MPPEAVDICQRLLVQTPSDRLGAGTPGSSNDMDALKAHALFAGLDIDNIYSMDVPPYDIPAIQRHESDDDLELQILNR